MNPAVKIKVEGMPQLLNRLGALKPAKFNEIVRGALKKAARIEVNAIKGQLRPGGRGYDTGALRKASAFKVKTSKRKQTLSYAVVGAQRSAKRDGSLTKFGMRLKGRQKGRAPANYAHLVEFDHRIAVGGTLKRLTGKQKGKAAISKRTGVAGEGTSEGLVMGIGFMSTAAKKSEAAAVAAIKAHLQQGVRDLAAKGKI